MATETRTKTESVDIQQLAIWTVIGGVAAAIVNAILFLVTQGQFEGVEAMGQAFTIMPVIFASVIGVVGGGILLGILDRFIDNPIRVWRWVAIVVLLLSLALPFVNLEGEPTMTARIILIVMHIVTGGLAIYLLTTRTQKAM